MPKIDFTDEERAALADVAGEYVRTHHYQLTPRLGVLKSALLKLAPTDGLSGLIDDPQKIIGVLLSVLLPALAGHMSWGMRGFIAGSLAGIALGFGVLRAVQTPIDEGRPFDPMPLDDVKN
jgi:hypothetical protein